MNTQQIDQLLRKDPLTKLYFIGVYAADQLASLKITKEKWLLVCNCCPSSLPGQHWIAFFGNDKGEIDFFDSFGLPPNAYRGVPQFLHRRKPEIVRYNAKQLQSFESDACGPYCLFFGYLRSRGLTLVEIIKETVVVQNSKKRDELITDVVRNVFY